MTATSDAPVHEIRAHAPAAGGLYSLSQTASPTSHVPAHFDHLGRTGYWGNLYSDIADPAVRWSFVRRQALLERLMDPIVGPKTRVVEIGPGTGNLVGYFASRGCEYRAFDAARAMADATNAAISRHPGLALDSRCDVGDIHALPLADGYADVVVAAGVLEYLEDPARAASELARITRRPGRMTSGGSDQPGGIALITLPNARSLNRQLMQRLGFLTRVWNRIRSRHRATTPAPDVRRIAYTPGRFAHSVAGENWQLDGAFYYDVEVLPYPLTRLLKRLAFSAKRAAEGSSVVPKSLFANGMVLSLSRTA